MCSWCYGLMNPLEELTYNFGDDLEVEVVMGGLRPGGGDPWDENFKSVLKNHWDQVHEATGQPFSKKIFELETFEYNTEPACRAVSVVKKISPESAYEFFKKIQHQFFAEGQDPNKLEFYDPILNALSIDRVAFHTLYRSEEGYSLTEQDFTKTAQFRVRGFPTLFLDMNDRLFPITYGYATYSMLKDRLTTYLQQN